MDDMTDHDIIIRIQQDMKWLMKSMSNHLHHHEVREGEMVKYHRALILCTIGVVLSGLVSIGVVLFQG